MSVADLAGAAPQIPFEGLFNASANPYMVLDRDLVYVAVNDAYLKLTERRREDLIGNHVFANFPPTGQGRRQLSESFANVMASKKPDSIALIHYPLRKPGGGVYDSWWTAVHTPVLDDRGEVAFILQHTVDVTPLRPDPHAPADAENAAALVGKDLFRRAQEVQAENVNLAASFKRLRRLFVQAPGFMAVSRGPDHVLEFANKAFLALVGREDLIGRTARQALPETESQGFIDMLDRVQRSGEPCIGFEAPIQFRRADRIETLFVDFIYQPIIEADGQVGGVLVQGADVTERVRAQERQRLMIAELDHRVKNTLATVQSIAQQTLRASADLTAFGPAFESRLLALSQTHNALTRGHWEGADLHDILQGELKPYGMHRIALDGPVQTLEPRASLALGMVFHELATNAAKYGALSVSEGELKVSWRIDEGDDPKPRGELHLVWREAGGPPPPETPKPKGFGSRLVQRSVEGELGGRVKLALDPGGFIAEIRLPILREPRS